jgi:PAS domain S-box-containing protein
MADTTARGARAKRSTTRSPRRDSSATADAAASAQFETLLNAAPLGVYLVDADFRIRAVNPVARPAFGDAAELIGRDFDEAIHTIWERDFADEIVRVFRSTLETGEPYVSLEHAERRKDRGVVEYYEWRLHRLPLPEGRFGVVCYFRDVSAEVEARERIVASEEHARTAQTEAEAANRAKDDFLATISHELRTPLQGILGWLSLLKRGRLDSVQTARALDSIERSVRLQAQLVHDILDVSRIMADKVDLELAPLDLAALLAKTAEELMPGAVAKDIELTIDAPRAEIVLGDRERLHQVVSNLLMNALKFTPEGGRVALTCRRSGRDVVVTVTDTGEGIASEFLPRLFERFAQADASSTRRHGGVGLGLAIVRHLVEMHGGSVAAESAGPGHGTTLTVRLPAERAAAPGRRRSRTATATTPRLDGVEILLVEDDRDVLESMTLALRDLGARVQPTASADEAFAAFTRREPHIVVSDLGMPDEDGYSMLRRMRRARRDLRVPAIALSGFTRPEDAARARAAGFAAHVAKPIEPDDLARVLVDVLAGTARLH